jgi:phosphoribosyl 1,2-cyclic phosphodiesterase
VIETDDSIIFLGTAGARVMVSRQLLASGGAWLSLDGMQLLVDPGPGTLVRAIEKKLNPASLDAIILSHKHLDHSVDINIMIEAMTSSGWTRRGIVLAPADAMNNKEGVILPYVMAYPERIETLAEGKSYSIGSVVVETPVQHKHGVETYGFVFKMAKHTISWIVDTGYFESLSDYYTCDLLIINMVMMEHKPMVEHLSPVEVAEIIKGIRPKLCIITHFGMSVWQAKPGEVADRLSSNTGIPVIAARDGMKFELKDIPLSFPPAKP